MTITRRHALTRAFDKGTTAMKEKFEELEWEVICFTSADIITTSREYDEDLDGEYVEE